MTAWEPDELETFLGRETSAEVPAAMRAVAEAARARHGPSVAAVLFYGSCLRETDDRGKIVDLYLLVDDYRSAHRSLWGRWGNALLPPNVYYVETLFEDRPVRAKYAVISLAEFERAAGGGWLHSYIWARFAQPCRLLDCRDQETRHRVVATLAAAVRTLVAEARPLLPETFTARELWEGSLAATYRAELRAERPDRIPQVYATDAARYQNLTSLVLPAATSVDDGSEPRFRYPDSWTGRANHGRWWRRRWAGKLLSVLRLMKAAFTFQGGPKYILWKIERHSGVRQELTAWQERHPILASAVLFWRLYRKGAFR